ncbi:MAG TPA: HNH endonuclease, partial [Nocardioidaceae bacterium]|nr:HNH endonuclease [Nocardioidaceae bacterium]
GDPRGRGQLMADALVGAVTGRDPAVGTDVCVDLVMTDAAALGGSAEPARVAGYGPIPAGIARDLLRGRPPADPGQTGPGGRTAQARVWVRRLYADPATGLPVAADIRRRLFPAALRRLLVLRDDVCRTPWCGAPIRHLDHVSPHAAGGATAADNGQGLCEACNLRKQRPGWSARARPGGVIETTTPTGHSYHSRPPPLPGYRPA